MTAESSVLDNIIHYSVNFILIATHDLVGQVYYLRGNAFQIKLPNENFKLPNVVRGLSMDNTYQFPAVRGIQAGREYYVIMCPLKLVPKLFVFDDAETPPDMRAQRVLNRARIPEITRYLVNNTEDYVLSSITACVDGEVAFEPFAEHGHQRSVGLLRIDMNSRILVNDGQHRQAAISEALKQKPRLGDESISVVFFIDAGLERSQQWFSDLNKHAVRPTRSIGILYDRRDALSKLARDLERQVPIFHGLTELEKTTIANRSTRLFTLSAVYQASKALLNKKRADQVSRNDLQIARDYWITLGELIPEWSAVIRGEIATADLRHDYIHAYGVTLQALGITGSALLACDPDCWRERLEAVQNIDWRRSNSLWNGRALIRGKMSKARDSILLTANAIKLAFGIELSAEEQRLEDSYQQQMRREL